MDRRIVLLVLAFSLLFAVSVTAQKEWTGYATYNLEVEDTACSSYTYQSACLSNPGCYWDQQSYKCYDYVGVTSSLCSDPDSGSNVNSQAHTYGFREQCSNEQDCRIRTGGRDACTSADTIREHYCSSGYIKSSNMRCSYGCMNGECVQSSDAISGQGVVVTLSEGETTSTGFSGRMYETTLVYVSSTGAKFSVNGQLTPILEPLESSLLDGAEIQLLANYYSSAVSEATFKLAKRETNTSSGTDVPSCTDSDGGLTYNTKGTTTGVTAWHEPILDNVEEAQDICTTINSGCVGCGETYEAPYLIEYHCAAHPDDGGDKIYAGFDVITCPNGCRDGRCLDAPEPEPTSCIDSDGGDYKNTKGTVKGNLQDGTYVEYTDSCTTRNGISGVEEGLCGIVEERQCNPDVEICDSTGTVKETTEIGVYQGTNVIAGPNFRECSNGCRDGECIELQEPVMSEAIRVGEVFTLKGQERESTMQFEKLGLDQNVATFNHEETGIKEITYDGRTLEGELIVWGEAFRVLIDENWHTVQIENAQKLSPQPSYDIWFEHDGQVFWRFLGAKPGQKLSEFVNGEVPSSAFPSGRVSTSLGSSVYEQNLRFIDDVEGDWRPTQVLRAENNLQSPEWGLWLYVPERTANPWGAFLEYDVSFDPGFRTIVWDKNGESVLDEYDDETIQLLGDYFVIVDTEIKGRVSEPTVEMKLVEGYVIDVLAEGESKKYTLDGRDYRVTLLSVGTSNGLNTAKFEINGQVTDTIMEGFSDARSDGVEIGVTEALVGAEGSVSFDLNGGEIQSLTEGETKTISVGGKNYEVTVLIISNNNGVHSVKLMVNGEITDTLENDESDTLIDGTRINVHTIAILPSGDTPSIAEFYLTRNSIVLTDANAVDGDSARNLGFENNVEVNRETIEDGWVRIEGSIVRDKGTIGTVDRGDIFELRRIKYRLNADGLTGTTDLYIPPGESLRQHLDEPEGLLSPSLDIRFADLFADTPGTTRIMPVRAEEEDQQSESESSGTCTELPAMLEACEPYRCEFTHPFTGTKMVRKITGMLDGKCHYEEEMPNNGLMVCDYNSEFRSAVADHYRSIENADVTSSTDLTTGETTHTINGEVVENPLQEALDTGVCVIKGYEDESTDTPKTSCDLEITLYAANVQTSMYAKGTRYNFEKLGIESSGGASFTVNGEVVRDLRGGQGQVLSDGSTVRVQRIGDNGEIKLCMTSVPVTDTTSEPEQGASCPTPMCEAPPEGCRIVHDGEIGPDGCLVNPCGRTVCDQQEQQEEVDRRQREQDTQRDYEETGVCNGCELGDRCIPQGTRFVQEGIDAYCNYDSTLARQRVTGEACQNNYECLTNECSSGTCVDIQGQLEEQQRQLEEQGNMIQRILDWLSRLVG